MNRTGLFIQKSRNGVGVLVGSNFDFSGDRTDHDTVADASQQANPDVVVDCAAYHPAVVRTATDIFTDTAAYVYVSNRGLQ